MSTERLPHPWFSAYWALWALSTVPVAVVTAIPGGRWYGLLWWVVWFVAFLAAEIPAALIDTRMRDTLSEVATWLHRKLAKGEHRWDRGWTAFVSVFITLLAVTGALPWLVVGLMVPWQIAVVLWAMGLLQAYLTWRWLYDHWIDTIRWGAV